MDDGKKRCTFAEEHPELREYHDTIWGSPQHEDNVLFDWMAYNIFQAGLGWIMMLKKWPSVREAWKGFDPKRIATFTDIEINELLHNPKGIRNEQKIMGVLNNANKFMEIQKEFGSFDKYLWQWVNGKQLHCTCTPNKECNVGWNEAEALSKDLKKRGFKFMGHKTTYGYMEDVGLVNDHSKDCFRYEELKRLS